MAGLETVKEFSPPPALSVKIVWEEGICEDVILNLIQDLTNQPIARP